MSTAVVLIRRLPHYRHDSFVAGFKRLGFTVKTDFGHTPKPGDVLAIWNRYTRYEREAEKFEAAGAAVLVAENGYIATKDSTGRPDRYAISVGGHNGSGKWPDLGPDRFDSVWKDRVLQPFRGRGHGEYVLVCGQRGIGSKTMASPADWHWRAAERLKAKGFAVRVRPHPESRTDKKPERKLYLDLAAAQAVAIWSSNVGIQALWSGIPVFYDAPHWIASAAAARLADFRCWTDAVENDGLRRQGLAAAANAQWSLAEIESGFAFDMLLTKCI